MVCLAGLATDQIIMVVSSDPLATNSELGDQATVLTRALWKPHSLLWAGYTKMYYFSKERNNSIIQIITLYSSTE